MIHTCVSVCTCGVGGNDLLPKQVGWDEQDPIKIHSGQNTVLVRNLSTLFGDGLHSKSSLK
jgi:hypothetical protein